MTNFEKWLLGGMALLSLAVIGLAITFTKQPNINISVNTPNGAGGTVKGGGLLGATTQTTATYATGEAVTNQGGLYLYGTESTEGLEVAGVSHFGSTATFTGAITSSGGITSSGNTRSASLVKTGAVATKTTTSTLTAAEVCDSGLLVANAAIGLTTTPLSITLPTTSTLFADCLTTNGDSIFVPFYNASSVTTTLLTIGTGGTTGASSTVAITPSNLVWLGVSRVSATAYMLSVSPN